jgi:diguanylate cyclase (GGDEF)-like protein
VKTVNVVERGTRLGQIAVGVAVDDVLLRELSTALDPHDRLVAVRGGHVVAGAPRSTSLALRPGAASRARLEGATYRGLATAPLPAPAGLEFIALTPQRAIDAAARATEARVTVALLGSIVLFTLVAWLLGRSVVTTLRRLADAANDIAAGRLGARVEVSGRDEFAQLGRSFNGMAAELEQRVAELEAERVRVRAASARFGEALAATHDSTHLMKVIAEGAVEAVGAAGGVVLGRDGELARAGDPEGGAERVAFPLRVGSSDFGLLVISSPGFDADQMERAVSLSAQAVVALENARLHQIVERQAFADGLTGLANRRSLEETLRAELARGARFDTPVCLVLADLDHFKQVNDQYGHPTGDEVLRAFGGALKQTLRESDVAGRWGGEEFALILTGTDAAGGARLAERAREAFEACVVESPRGERISVTASFGVASYPECLELGELIAAADSALYAAKREGRNRVIVSMT